MSSGWLVVLHVTINCNHTTTQLTPFPPKQKHKQFPDAKAQQEQERLQQQAAAEGKEAGDHPLARATLEEMDEAEVSERGWVCVWSSLRGLGVVWCCVESNHPPSI